MSAAPFTLRKGHFDVILAAAPLLPRWPSLGVETLSRQLAAAGLRVGLFGGATLKVKGVLPLAPATGGVVFVEDGQKRTHRLTARAVVKITHEPCFPYPFPGWYSPGLIPFATAEKLLAEQSISFDPLTLIFGSGNTALRFGSKLLQQGASKVLCVETQTAGWQKKSYAGWEVERRRFEMLRGKVIQAEPLELTAQGPLSWQLRLRDAHGIRIIDAIARLVSVGPYLNLPEIKEYPPHSLLFELEQSALSSQAECPEAWELEGQGSEWLTAKITRALLTTAPAPTPQPPVAATQALHFFYRRTKNYLKKANSHQQNPFTPRFEGKWLARSTLNTLQTAPSVPQTRHHFQATASLECFEAIGCRSCQTACPTTAISLVAHSVRLSEDRCTGCGQCLAVCPANAIVMVQQQETQSLSQLTLHWRGAQPWLHGETAQLVNRRGEWLGTGRVLATTIAPPATASPSTAATVLSLPLAGQWVTLTLPTYLLWEARSLKRAKPESGDRVLEAVERRGSKNFAIEILLNGEKRRTREAISISRALFEMGQSRAEDNLLCEDGSCGRCILWVDGVKKLACLTPVRPHRVIRFLHKSATTTTTAAARSVFCPCLQIQASQVTSRIEQGKLSTPEAVLAVLQVGAGECHGSLCRGALKQAMQAQGVNVDQWIDWRFPWVDWSFF